MRATTIALRISGTIFGLVALLHLIRMTFAVEVLLNGWPLPSWISGFGFIIPLFLCFWLWKLSMRKKERRSE